MCGIAGSFLTGDGKPSFNDQIEEALQCIAHRGPDDQGVFRNGRAVLGQRRLSIIDTSPLGHQPFTDEGGRFTITFNGEVFNFQELKAALETDGHVFRSRTDTEVVLRLFTVKGPAFLHELNGFFALAIYDHEQDTLFVARDRFGVKPLLWSMVDGRFLFASELRALIALGAKREPDPLSAEQYFTHHYIPAPYSVFKGTQKLLPGHTITVDAAGAKVERWYDIVKASKRVVPGTDPKKKLFDLMNDAVRLRLIADVPVGTFLSGGVDSSIVSALAAAHHKNLHTFSIGYADDPFYDESQYAEEVAKHIGSEHHSFKLTRDDLAENYVKLLAATDEPFADSSALPSLILCERTRKKVTVALSGDGADEIFGGYRKHQAEMRWRAPGPAEKAVRALAPLWRMLPQSRNSALQDRVRQYDRFARLAITGPEERFLELASFADLQLARELVTNPSSATDRTERQRRITAPLGLLPGMNGVLLADLVTTLPNDMLHKVDLTSMANALEVRTPFLDLRVVEFAFSLPADAKMHVGSGKYILRDTFGHLLPTRVMTRSKKGFEVPLFDLLRGPLSGLTQELITEEKVEAAGLAWKPTQRVMAEFGSASPGTSQATVHALLVYLSWWQRHMC